MPRNAWRLDNFEWLKANILKNYMTVDMFQWGAKDSKSPCGTVGCIAGTCDWLMNLSGEKPVGRAISFDYTDGSYERRKPSFLFKKDGSLAGGKPPSLDAYDIPIDNAKAFLGIDGHEARALFYPDNWPSDFAHRLYIENDESDEYEPMPKGWTIKRTRKHNAQVIVDRIDYFLETGE